MNDTTQSIDVYFEPNVKQGIVLLAVYTTVVVASTCASAYVTTKLQERLERRKKIAPVITIA